MLKGVIMPKKYEKFTRAELQDLCTNSTTLSEFGTKMGYSNYSSSGINAAKEVIKKYNLNTDSLITYSNVKLGINPNKGKIDYSKFTKKNLKRPRRESLRKNLISIRGHKCEGCKLEKWNNQPIPLEIHHIDGDTSNNESNNLQLLCPNCHSLTDNFRGKNNKANNYKVSDDELAASLANSTSIRQAVMKLGLAETVGALYPRCYKIMTERQITLLPKN